MPRHANLVNCEKVQLSSSKNFYLIMAYCNGGTLGDIISKGEEFSERGIWLFLEQFCQGYQVLYDSHLVHRDIKPDNILLHNGVYKISDFGLSTKIYDYTIAQNISFKGTPIYMAPEICLKQEGSSKIDVFSLGIILYQMLYDGDFPFFSTTDNFKNVD